MIKPHSVSSFQRALFLAWLPGCFLSLAFLSFLADKVEVEKKMEENSWAAYGL